MIPFAFLLLILSVSPCPFLLLFYLVFSLLAFASLTMLFNFCASAVVFIPPPLCFYCTLCFLYLLFLLLVILSTLLISILFFACSSLSFFVFMLLCVFSTCFFAPSYLLYFFDFGFALLLFPFRFSLLCVFSTCFCF